MNEPGTSQDDGLLGRLGELAREEPGSRPAALDERWERLAAGALSADEEAELRRLAERSEEARAAYEAFRPLGGDFQAGVVRAIREQKARPAGKVVPFRPAWRRVASWGAVAAAAAAVVTMLVRAPPLPSYAIAELAGGASTMRGERADATRLSPGDRFQAILRPETAVRRATALDAEAFLLREGELRRLDVDAEPDPSGSVRLTGTLDGELPAGGWTLWLVVGRKGALPDSEDLRTFSAGAPVLERNWAALPKTLDIQPRPTE
jgi:ferric-dicitrate binding protein FerR (iron transport regulator)